MIESEGEIDPQNKGTGPRVEIVPVDTGLKSRKTHLRIDTLVTGNRKEILCRNVEPQFRNHPRFQVKIISERQIVKFEVRPVLNKPRRIIGASLIVGIIERRAQNIPRTEVSEPFVIDPALVQHIVANRAAQQEAQTEMFVGKGARQGE